MNYNRWLLAFALAAVSSCGSPGSRIQWQSGGIELVGTLVVPEGEGPHPLVVFVSGSGSLERNMSSNVDHSAQLAKIGLASLVFDKRGVGDSGGDWRKVGLKELAVDLLPLLEQLAANPKIDEERIGLMGLSQGAWVALMAAERSPHAKFVIWLSGPPMTPAEQGTSILAMDLQKKGWDKAAVAEALALDKLVIEVYRNDRGWDEASEAIEAARSKQWFDDAGIGIQLRDSWNWRWYASFFDHDPLPALHALEKPLLAIYGEADHIVPAVRSKAILDGLAGSAPAARDTVMLPTVGHDLGAKGSSWPAAYWSVLESWFRKHGVIE